MTQRLPALKPSAWFHKFAIVYRRQLLDRSLTVAARKAL